MPTKRRQSNKRKKDNLKAKKEVEQKPLLLPKDWGMLNGDEEDDFRASLIEENDDMDWEGDWDVFEE